MPEKLEISGISVDVTFKDIKNIHLSVHPPTGHVRIAAPERMELETIRVYVVSKLGWIKKQQRQLRQQERETPREYLERESHYVWGKRYLLEIVEAAQTPNVELKHDTMVLTMRPGSTIEKRQSVVSAWYREELRKTALPLIEKWEPLLGVNVERLYIRHMKTKWGSCNHQKRTIRLNTELAKKSPECLEYIVVHEMVHLLEPSHNTVFVELMNQFLPHWQHYRDELNRAPLGHVEWEY